MPLVKQFELAELQKSTHELVAAMQTLARQLENLHKSTERRLKALERKHE